MRTKSTYTFILFLLVLFLDANMQAKTNLPVPVQAMAGLQRTLQINPLGEISMPTTIIEIRWIGDNSLLSGANAALYKSTDMKNVLANFAEMVPDREGAYGTAYDMGTTTSYKLQVKLNGYVTKTVSIPAGTQAPEIVYMETN